MLLAFIIRFLEGSTGQDKLRDRVRHPLMICAFFLTASYCLSSFLSVTPHSSWWGSFARLQGTYTLLGYLIIFFITVLSLRNQDQIQRMVTTVILVSFPIAIYGLCQRFQLDPLPWNMGFVDRVASTLGNPIFFGGYLVMVIPLTLAQLILLVVGKANLSVKGESRRWDGIIFYGLLLVLQLVALVFTQSRGPIVGLAVGMFVFIVLGLLITKRRQLVVGIYGLAFLGIIFLVVFNIPQGPLESLKDTPYLGRLGKVFETTGGSGKIRLLIWEGVLNMVKNNPGRSVVGYGPEILYVPIHKYAPAELVRYEGRIAFPDRAHNEFFDILAGIGFIGLTFYLILIFLIGFYVLKWLGLIKTKSQVYTYVGLTILGILAGLFIPWFIQGNLVFIGIGVPLGIVAGVIGYLFIQALGNRQQATEEFLPFASCLMPLALFSGLIVHFIEIQFGIALTATRTYFWIMMAALLFWLMQDKQQVSNGATSSGSSSGFPRQGGVTTGNSGSLPMIMVMTLIMSVLIYDFVTTSSVSTILGDYKMRMLGAAFIGMWVIAGVFIISGSRLVLRTALAFIISGAVILIYAVALLLASPPRSEPITGIVVFYVWLLVWVVFTGYLLNRQEVLNDRQQGKIEILRWGNSLLYIVLILGMGAVVIWTNLRPLQGNI
ncbi:O-antigen ligase family protein, partial [Planctomycetota bacterium]